ncbi:MAG: 3-dehydroquinate synthase [Clostridia bacterium]
MVINVNTAVPYSIVIEKGAIEKVGELAASLYKKNTKVLVISDSNVFPIYGQTVMQSLQNSGFIAKSYVFTAGEENKQLATISDFYKALTDYKFTRSDVILALGGGVTGDMAGFAAATYLRGIDYIGVPTTLLSQVDSSVGGKTAVDLPQGKNLVGAFHQPSLVICDPETIKTLPKHYVIDGLGEIAKYACIGDMELFENLENGYALDNIQETITRCIDSKRMYVEQDPHEKGIRIMLNFGHTFGHAIEKLTNFKGISHGRAVAIGMVMICDVGEELGYTEKGTKERVKNLLLKLGLPTECQFSLEQILEATNLDKKSVGKMVKFIFLEEVGKPIVKQEERNYLILKFKILLEQKNRYGKSDIQ